LILPQSEAFPLSLIAGIGDNSRSFRVKWSQCGYFPKRLRTAEVRKTSIARQNAKSRPLMARMCIGGESGGLHRPTPEDITTGKNSACDLRRYRQSEGLLVAGDSPWVRFLQTASVAQSGLSPRAFPERDRIVEEEHRS
jgi:hypothetical protein